LSSASGCIGLPFLALGVWWGCQGESEAEGGRKWEGRQLRENEEVTRKIPPTSTPLI
jgi:hypothetical protein